MKRPDEKKHISYSAYSTYMQCPKKYDLHYNERLRPDSQPSYFVFGSMVDLGLNEILLGNDKASAMKAARNEAQRLHKEVVSLDPRDYDGDLIDEETKASLLKQVKKLGYDGEYVDHLAPALFGKLGRGEELSANQKKALNLLCEASMLGKAELMVNAFIKDVFPLFEDVVSVQENVKRGISDFKANVKGHGLVTGDNKTAARPYAEDAVEWSVQLAGYGAKKGMYVVFDKTIRKNRKKVCKVCIYDGTGGRHATCNAEIEGKRCGGEWDESVLPEVKVQILIGDIPESTRAMVEESYQATEKAIEDKHFPRNLTSCQNQFGKPCPYINYCWSGKTDGLVKVKKGQR